MIRVLLPVCLIVITSICVIYHQNPSVIKSFTSQKLNNLRTWGRIDIVDEKPIGSFKDIFHSQLLWQIFEQFLGFATGVSICVLIGWRVSSHRNINDKVYENQLAECLRRQNRFEKQLSALELQIIDFERSYLYKQKETSERCDNWTETATLSEETKQSTCEVNEDYKNNDESEGLVRQAVEVIMKQNFDELQFECILEKLSKILDRLSNLSKEKILPALESDHVLEQEKETGVEADNGESYGKGSVDVENKIYEIEAIEKTDEIEDLSTFSSPEVHEVAFQDSDISCENTSFTVLHPCKSKEKVSNMLISIVGAGECNETFKGKIVPVSQIPKYQEFRKNQKHRAKLQNEYDEENYILSITPRSPHDSVMSEGTPQSSPRKNRSSMDRSTSRSFRKKQRS